jgi:hypothetical protein
MTKPDDKFLRESALLNAPPEKVLEGLKRLIQAGTSQPRGPQRVEAIAAELRKMKMEQAADKKDSKQ